ncbi:DEAD/DEAH box helicase [Alteribacter natronophilus]|uniref:DEAD/DEAH box helicase n=1 Tax=Alteribacter natronophilus TaxID=2583810 RepID=UPI00110DDC39|nr:DEAD/DEAH box helicase [Alteribacter natronophilus]TMW70715.1 DEAD/DEAH box helicase [Alteribacter natronophilus]
MTNFANQFQPFIQTAWEKAGFTEPTAIQESAVPHILARRDVIAESPTGTGKTLAYLLPILHEIDPEKKDVQAVILASSQELVMQILEQIQQWGQGSGIRSASLIGGANTKRQLEKLKKKPHIVAGTPGRVAELVKQKKLKMHEVRTIVLDEGDQLLTSEHEGTIRSIIDATLRDRQLILFSATVPEETEKKADALMNEAEVIRKERDASAAGKVDHLYVVCEAREKVDILNTLVKNEKMKALAFINEIGEANVIGEKLAFKKADVSVLHSDTGKQERKQAISRFRDGSTPLLVATDVAARGLDVTGLTHVIQMDAPRDAKQYTHRAGRTGRQGAEGTVISLVTPGEERDLKRSARDAGVKLRQQKVYRGKLEDIQSVSKNGSEMKGKKRGPGPKKKQPAGVRIGRGGKKKK